MAGRLSLTRTSARPSRRTAESHGRSHDLYQPVTVPAHRSVSRQSCDNMRNCEYASKVLEDSNECSSRSPVRVGRTDPSGGHWRLVARRRALRFRTGGEARGKSTGNVPSPERAAGRRSRHPSARRPSGSIPTQSEFVALDRPHRRGDRWRGDYRVICWYGPVTDPQAAASLFDARCSRGVGGEDHLQRSRRHRRSRQSATRFLVLNGAS